MPQLPERKKQYAKERLAKNGPKIRAKSSEWRNNNRQYLWEKCRERRLKRRAMCLVAAARIRSRRKDIPFSLEKGDIDKLQSIIDIGKCEISGVEFNLSGPRSAISPSLDRIIPHLGYVPGNVRIVCYALNAGMGDWGEEELFRIVGVWVSLRKTLEALTK